MEKYVIYTKQKTKEKESQKSAINSEKFITFYILEPGRICRFCVKDGFVVRIFAKLPVLTFVLIF